MFSGRKEAGMTPAYKKAYKKACARMYNAYAKELELGIDSQAPVAYDDVVGDGFESDVERYVRKNVGFGSSYDDDESSYELF